MVGLQLVNSGQSKCYVTQMADVLSKNFSLPINRSLTALKDCEELYSLLVDLKIQVANALGNISEFSDSPESKMHNLIRLLLGQEITSSTEFVDENGQKIRRTVKNKVNPQIAKQILTHEILGDDNINAEADLSEAKSFLIRDKKRTSSLMPRVEKERIEGLFDTQRRACIDTLKNKDIGNRIISLGGAVRCGKTYIQAYYSLLHIEWLYNTPLKELKELYKCAKTEKNKGQIIFIGKTAPSVYQNIFSGIFSSFRINASLPKAKAFLWKILNYDIRLIGYGKMALESLKGITADLLIVDESEHLEVEGYSYLLSRLSNPWAKMILTWNPKTPSHWLWQKVKNPEAQKANKISHFNFALNKCEFADKEFIELLEADYGKGSPMYKRFVLGLPASVVGQVYSHFNEDKHVLSGDVNYGKYYKMYMGYDHGQTSPRVYVCIGVYYNNRGETCVDVIGELYYPPTHGTVKRNIDYLRELEIFYKQFRHIEALYVPHDAGDHKRLLEPLGYPLQNASMKLSVNSGIGLIQSLLSSGRMYVHENCKNIINEMFLYSYSTKETDEGKDKAISRHDHSLDALRYAIVSSNMFNDREETLDSRVTSLLD